MHQEEQLGAQNTALMPPDNIGCTSFVRQPSITTYCDRLERASVRADSTEPLTPKELHRSRSEHFNSLLFSRQCVLYCVNLHSRTSAKTFPIIELGGWSTSLHSTNRPRPTDIRRSNTLDSVGVMEIGV